MACNLLSRDFFITPGRPSGYLLSKWRKTSSFPRGPPRLLIEFIFTLLGSTATDLTKSVQTDSIFSFWLQPAINKSNPKKSSLRIPPLRNKTLQKAYHLLEVFSDLIKHTGGEMPADECILLRYVA